MCAGALARVHRYDFVLVETNYTRLCYTKSILTVNGQFPGPVIHVHRGDTVFVNVINQGYYGVTLHWHGVKQPRNPWHDGPEYITQCPIAPGTNFTYEVQFTTEEGTLWWHAHSDWTRVTIHGAIVILPPEGTPYPFPEPDAEEVIVLSCWYKGNLRQLLAEELETGSDTPRSDAYTINGQPGDFCACSNDSTYHVTVDEGKTYLMRIVNAVLNADLFLSIAGHNFTVVGMDASYVKPFETSYIILSPGQTMDVLVMANQSPSYYYIAGRQYSSDRLNVVNYDHSNVSAILKYNGNYTLPSSPMFPSSTLPTYKDNVAALRFMDRIKSLANEEHPVNVPLNVRTRMYVTVSMGVFICPNSSCGGIYGDRMASSMNNFTWINPSTDILQAYYRNVSGVYDTSFPDFPSMYYNFTGDDLPTNISVPTKGRMVKVLNYNESIEIVFQGTNLLDAAEAHPMHLHGYGFYVVGSGLGDFDEVNDPKGYNLIDPPYVNTISVPKSGWAAIRFRANNPGVWFLHCHYDRHLTWGMDTVLIVKNGGSASTSVRPPPPYMPPCDNATSPLGHWLNFVHDEDANYAYRVI
ncbi:hypothetical protein CRG98_017185 [Punica granatum]|nr:hypothetical protein CRG98_017185 [Punica granatum]